MDESERTWVPAPKPPEAEVLACCGVPPVLAPLLARRGVGSGEDAERFLHPSPDQLHDARRLSGVPEAVERLARARDDGVTVVIVGDYDADGISSTALLLAGLRACGLKALPILPNRLQEGYGFHPLHVERAVAQGAGVLITVDNGTTSHAAVREALDAGLDVVVVDHHLPGDPLPPQVVQINPRRECCTYPCADLAASGLALKLVLALAEDLGRILPLGALLRVACLGTIADLVPLRGENRVIAALGLEALEGTRSPGLAALIRESKLQPPFSAEDVGFRLGPRLNAAGRLGPADPALELLMTRDPARGAALARDLAALNRQRRDEEEQVATEARARFLQAGPAVGLPPLLVAWSPSWHRGVVGVAAGRLARELHRPTILLSQDGEWALGSGRSIPGVELHSFIGRWRGELERFGGHAQAIGLTVSASRLPELEERWQQAAAEWPPSLLRKRLEYELELEPQEIGPALMAQLAQLEPHGQGNPRPLARVGPMRLAFPPTLFGRGHLRAVARGEGGATVLLLGWGWQKRQERLAGDLEALGYLERDRYSGAPVLRLADIRGVGPRP